MKRSQYAEDRWFFIDTVQEWFECRGRFWLALSVLSLGSILVLQAVLVFATEEDPAAWRQSGAVLAPLLAVFVLSIFWRSIVHAVLAFTGAMMTFGGMFLFHTAGIVHQLDTAYVANRLGYGIKHAAVIDPNSLADRYLVVGIFALLFCLAMALRPGFFRSKNYDGLPYPVWRHSRDRGRSGSGTVRLIAVSAMLSPEERHAVARYKFLVVAIGGRKYLATPYDWIPQGSVVIRDDGTNSFIGIP